MAALGANLILSGSDFDEAKVAAADYAARTGALLVVDGAEPFIAEGGGTIGYELVRDHGSDPLDVLLVPLGNGAQIAGIGTWVKSVWPSTQVVGVAAAGAPAMALSWRSGRVIEGGHIMTIADGLAVRVPIPYALAVMRDCVDDVITVTDDEISAAMYLVYRHFGLVTEPAGAAGIAAVLADPERYAGGSVGTVLCGANVEHEVFMRMVEAGSHHV
jgi:threonine dehydratase